MHDLSLLRCVAYSCALAAGLAGVGYRPPSQTYDSDTDANEGSDTDTDANKGSDTKQSQRLQDSLNELQSSLEAYMSDTQQHRHQDDVSAVKELATSCKTLCGRILAAVHTIRGPKRVGTSLNTWRSSLPAVRTSRQAFELRKLSERLQDVQTILALQLNKISSSHVARSKHQMRQIQLDSRKLQCRKSDRLKSISGLLRTLETRLRALQHDSSQNAPSLDDIALFQSQIQHITDQQQHIQRDHAVLKSLAFRSNVARHDTIPAAHQRTFAWVFAASPRQDTDSSSPGLRVWLEQGSGIFWVSGKPGAGKSTLIKYIADDARTQEALSKWSAPKKSVIVSHYFWCAGTLLQRSHNGLLQTLLFDMLRQLSDAIHLLLPERWRAPEAAVWTLADLHQALESIVQHPHLPVKLCFFIDGLDEFQGDHLALCHELLALSKSDNVKLCLSSRPWSVFEEAFEDGKRGHLRLHDVTKTDIVHFVLDRFAQYPEITKNLTLDDLTIIALEMSERSQGVFLWVSLATKCLLETLTVEDSLSSLLNRLRQYPPELDDLFTYNLEAIPTSKQARMATSFLITQVAEKPLDLGMYYFHEMEFSDPDYVLTLSPDPPSRLEYRRQLSHTTHQLETLCRGLVAVDQKTKVVNCLHRTVRDYLDQPQTKDLLNSKAPLGFAPSLCLLRAAAAWAKSSRATMSEEPRSEFVSSITSLLAAAAQLQGAEDVALCHRLLDHLDGCLVAKGPGAEESLQILRAQVVGHRVWKYLSGVDARRPRYFAVLEVPPLVLALFPDYEIGEVRERRPRWDYDTRQTVTCLLEQGQDPNKPFSTAETLGTKMEKTPWSVLCEHVLPQHDEAHTGTIRKVQAQLMAALDTGILAAFLRHGANANARCERPGKPVSVAATDYLLHAFRLCKDEDQVLKALYLEHVHWFAPKDRDYLSAVMDDFSRLMEKTRGQNGSAFLQQMSEKLLATPTQLQHGDR
ncbi:NACHT nucleoside triphosphatase [Cordyceps militaris]|uniref:NACHT nucleoside triphosphatase n=1 Tax=Cordyceps militaris TaxID=73501 RepID=A0A2H4S8K0_CORMI|nr:NACHT nucleoside triphosphatase [Cordyceps militaris]ATY59483.1 NACHT nucleoside triphosphatase [Cordyceps militaris]